MKKRGMHLRGAAAVFAVTLTALLGAGCADSGAKTAAEGEQAGQPGGDALKIGFSNMATGPVSFPAVTQGAEVAAKYLNAERNGIGGRPISLVNCDMKNDNQSAQQCGQKIANDSSIPFGITGLTLNGAPYYSAMKSTGKPTLIGRAITDVDSQVEGSYSYFAGTEDFYLGVAEYAKEAGARSIAYIHEDSSAAIGGKDTALKALQGSGITAKTTSVQATAADVLAEISSSGAQSADLLVLMATTKCPQIAQGLQSLGIKPKAVLAVSTCLQPAQIPQNPSWYEGWTLQASNDLPVEGTGKHVDLFLQKWKQYGPGGTPGTFAEIGWANVLNAAEALRDDDKLTAESISAAFQNFRGPSVFGPSEVKCPGRASQPSVCGTELSRYTISNGEIIPKS